MILIILLAFPFFCFSQDALIIKGNSKVFNSNNVKLSPEQVRSLLSNNSDALHLYNSGKTKKTVGNILLYGGISTVIIKHFSMLHKYKVNRDQNFETSNVMYFVGAGIVLISIPIKIGFSRKIEKSIDLINEDFKNPKNVFNIETTNFISNGNGFGISLTF